MTVWWKRGLFYTFKTYSDVFTLLRFQINTTAESAKSLKSQYRSYTGVVYYIVVTRQINDNTFVFFLLTITILVMNAWFISYHRCRSVIHLCRLSSRLILRALGFHQPGMTDPQLESHRSQLPTECLRRCTVYHPALRQDIDSFAFCFVTYPSNT